MGFCSSTDAVLPPFRQQAHTWETSPSGEFIGPKRFLGLMARPGLCAVLLTPGAPSSFVEPDSAWMGVGVG